MHQFRSVFALSKAEVDEAMPPGTSRLISESYNLANGSARILTHTCLPKVTSLARTRSQHHSIEEKHIHLVPEPSNDPADPLVWPLWRKLVVLGIMGLYAILSNFQSSILSSAFPELVTAWAAFTPDGPPTGLVPFSDLAHLTAVNSLMLGASAVFWVPLANSKSLTHNAM